jgi:hypothetical protein
MRTNSLLVAGALLVCGSAVAQFTTNPAVPRALAGAVAPTPTTVGIPKTILGGDNTNRLYITEAETNAAEGAFVFCNRVDSGALHERDDGK